MDRGFLPIIDFLNVEPAEQSNLPSAISWLISYEGLATLNRWRQRSAEFTDALKLQNALRKEFSFDRAVAIAQQVLLNEKIKQKFPDYPFLLSTEKGIQQATDQAIAQYKSKIIASQVSSDDLSFVDMCCGIGGDLISFNKQLPCTGIDSDPITAAFAQTNCQLAGINSDVFCLDVETLNASDCTLVHIDPDRRPADKRTINPLFFKPSLSFLASLIYSVKQVVVKSAPGMIIHSSWLNMAQWEWIEHNGECKQSLGWYGFPDRPAGMLRATIVHDGGGYDTYSAPVSIPRNAHQFSNGKFLTLSTYNKTITEEAPVTCKYIYAPAPSLSVSGLIPAFCEQYGLEELSPGGYLGADVKIDSPFLSAFEIVEVFPISTKVVKQALKQRGIEHIVIKKRGATIKPEDYLRKIGLDNNAPPNAPVLLLFDKHAVLGKRINDH